MPHVFVETNWVVDCCAPAHNRVPAATDLLRRARNGDLQLYLPSICLAESRRPLSQKFQTRLEADRIRRYVTWALGEGRIAADHADIVRTVIQQMENAVRDELRVMEDALRELAAAPGLEVINYDADMMGRAMEIGFRMPEIKPIDQAIFACVIVRAERLYRGGDREMFFCELDSDLQPWGRDGQRIEKLATAYDDVNVWVCGDYLLQSPPVPENWHRRRD